MNRVTDIEEGLLNMQSQSPQTSQPSSRQKLKLKGNQFKKKSTSSSSGSDSSGGVSSRAVFCGPCGGRHPTTQCIGVHGVCHLCGKHGHFARVCPSARRQCFTPSHRVSREHRLGDLMLLPSLSSPEGCFRRLVIRGSEGLLILSSHDLSKLRWWRVVVLQLSFAVAAERVALVTLDDEPHLFPLGPPGYLLNSR
ncbi:hypothetical protein F511_28834 [Dorcoceras hygrometricum]|uniref:CCHC-type domain-containing protein n=1 Tax=Dorcoceras hygrometricum TaxID=472368 RepID=A0A2Z7D613_9LAMI|nr:hypothetical protein F511_28834 [Dorcoceras hygrometricum]